VEIILPIIPSQNGKLHDGLIAEITALLPPYYEAKLALTSFLNPEFIRHAFATGQ
jgi:hypothetical protein